MRKWIETTGRTQEDAIAAALIKLGLDRDDVSIEVLERPKQGFLGIGGNPAKVRISYDAPDEQLPEQTQPAQAAPAAPSKPVVSQTQENAPQTASPAQSAPDQVTDAAVPAQNGQVEERISSFLAGLMQHMQVQATPEISISEEGNYKVTLQGSGLGAIIGRRGETLDAIQQLTNYAVNRGQTNRVRIHVDAENYRAKREEALVRLAQKVAGKVVKYRKSVSLEPMNAYERHVIHAALQEYSQVETHSTGVEPNRRIVVTYAPK